MKWKCQVDRADFPHVSDSDRLKVAYASVEATASNNLTDDVKREQEKLLWADTVIFQFPLWWLSMPAIKRGWMDKVYSLGFAYGLREYTDQKWGNRYVTPFTYPTQLVNDRFIRSKVATSLFIFSSPNSVTILR
jgi:NAD(P)H dehydrogenase (quinone)